MIYELGNESFALDRLLALISTKRVYLPPFFTIMNKRLSENLFS